VNARMSHQAIGFSYEWIAEEFSRAGPKVAKKGRCVYIDSSFLGRQKTGSFIQDVGTDSNHKLSLRLINT
jgi:hypothetical protein